MNFYFTHLFKLIIMLNLRNENIPIIYLIIIGNQIMETHHEKEKVTDKVIVLGGGLAGCEVAIHFAREGKQVKLVEMNSELSPDANVRHRPLLLAEIEKCGIEVYKNHKALEVNENGSSDAGSAEKPGVEHVRRHQVPRYA